MRRYPPVSAVSLSTAVIVLFLLQLFPTDAVAAPQKERQLRREIVVVGPQPAHRRIVLEQLTDRGYLGVHLLNLTPELRVHFGAPATSGVLVSRVLPEQPGSRCRRGRGRRYHRRRRRGAGGTRASSSAAWASPRG